jgi:asparagine synthase (glutamine-hydrolysing)
VLPVDLIALGFQGDVNLDFRQKVLSEAQLTYPDEPVRQAMYLDQHTFLVSLLDRVDRMTMGASMEARVPFLDFRLVALSGALSTRTHFQGLLGKQLLRKAFSDRLPSSVLKNPKWGFGVPWKEYFRFIPELRELVANLHASTLLMDGPFDTDEICSLASSYLQGDDRSAALVQQLAVIVFWWQHTQKQVKK